MKSITQKFLVFLLIPGLLGIASCTKEVDTSTEPSSNPVVSKTEPAKASANILVTLTGSGLGSVKSIYLSKDSIPVTFNPVLNTTAALMFRIPAEAVPGDQNIVITNSAGTKVMVPFTVLGLAVVTDVSNYNFTANAEITLTGKNLADVSKVLIGGTSTELTIVSKTLTQLVVKFPAAPAVNRAPLELTNAAGRTVTTQEFVNLANAFVIFTDDYGSGFDNASWGPAEVSTTFAKTGTKSFKATYNKGNWSADGFASWSTGVPNMPEYKYFTFWVKGASMDLTLYITGDKRAGGYGNSDQSMPVLIPANVWTYFKIPMATLEFWKTGSPFKQLGFWIKGPDTQNESFYFDDVIFVK